MEKFGISVAMLTPFEADGSLDATEFAAHALAVLEGGADGVTLFGTTGEGASLSAAERAEGLDAILRAGIPAAKITLAVYACALADAQAQIATGLAAGVTQFLVPPPFYFPAAEQDGLHAWYARLFETTDAAARIILYHIPQVTAVPLSADLVARLLAEFPGRVRAVKDSSCDWPTTESFLKIDGLPVLVGDERLLHRAAGMGGAGSITGCANLYPERLKRVFETGREDPALSAFISAIVAQPVVPALKAVQARASGNPVWENLRAPLLPLTGTQRDALPGDLDAPAEAEPADG